MNKAQKDLVVIMGPTASGKTAVAAHLALLMGGVILSGDSRQVYRGMDIGTGKDLADYIINGTNIPYYLIDICEPGEEYNIFRYKKDFAEVMNALPKDTPKILCGGSGLYIESVLNAYEMADVPEDPLFRKSLEAFSLEELIEQLKAHTTLHNSTDTSSRKRVIRALEIAKHSHSGTLPHKGTPLSYGLFAIEISRELRRKRITERLHARLQEGMIEEIEALLRAGVPEEMLLQYGLEYRYITLYLTGKLNREAAVSQLEIAIHQFAKRQMTWLRGMPKRGLAVEWVTPEATPAETAQKILDRIKQKQNEI
ncbi:tRNA (adenosine(37)-N6)-dimethylallyltransferase MiaA [Porphyromonas canoris]|uniref:tRNA dimethylallyltransferase n=1 Tax=Porphyromonas canoris TaxID=36875 RepID=A0ABR4XJ72_9PORP|nr:tRNA (adenosine(37)-N6)-dimethylallyltransferase MiaA [Porphyromonas canoris]KGN91749.1 tRNA delta(2)-isopentenylpyrophosphate transferase [Porphyromonas canoris]